MKSKRIKIKNKEILKKKREETIMNKIKGSKGITLIALVITNIMFFFIIYIFF